MLYLINQFTPSMLNQYVGDAHEILIERITIEAIINLLGNDSPFTQKSYINYIDDDRINRYLFEQVAIAKPKVKKSFNDNPIKEINAGDIFIDIQLIAIDKGFLGMHYNPIFYLIRIMN